MKKKLAVIMAAVMTVVLAACGASDSGSTSSSGASSSAAESTTSTSSSSSASSASSSSQTADSDVTIGVVVMFEHDYYSKLQQGAQDACEELGYEFVGMAPSGTDDIEGQVKMCEDMVTNGVDVLMVAPIQEETLYNAFDEAVEKGTLVMGVDVNLTGYENKTAFVGTNNEAELKKAAEKMASMLPEGANVVIIRGPLGNANHEARAKGATEGFEEAGCNVLEVKDANMTAEEAAAAVEDLMTKYADVGIDGVLCCDDDMAAGAIQAISQAGKSDEIIVSGFDGTAVGIQNVADGLQAFDLAQDPYTMGYQAVYVAQAAMNGEEYEEDTYIDAKFITQDNYQDFQ